MNFPASIYRLCLVTDRDLSRGRSLVDVVSAALRGGVSMVQLREKSATTRVFLEEARALRALLRGTGVPLIINDRADIALAAEADGVHVGQTDMPLEAVRRLVGADRLIGLSITDADQIGRADAQAADYLGIGPVHAQATKAAASPPLGLGGFARLRRLTRKPVLAIGGVKPQDTALLLEEGADGFAVVSAIMAADDPAAAARAFEDARRKAKPPPARRS